MTWEGCDLVECIPGKVSGKPVIKGTRIMPDVIVRDFDAGVPIEEIQENYPSLTLAIITELIAFAHQPQT